VIAQTNKFKVDSLAQAKAWLRANGYAEVKDAWMKGQRYAARLETLVTGRVAIIEGVAA
jgi:hypothetical protein